MTRSGRRALLGAALALVLASGCTADDEPAPDLGPAPAVDLGFTQLLPEEGSSRVLLRVINRETQPIAVTGVGVEWSGYGDVLVATDGEKTVPAESELMLPLELPEPACTEGGIAPDGRVNGRIEVAGQVVTQPLTEPAQVYVRRLWSTQCDQRLLESTVRISYAEDPRQVTGRQDLLQSALVLMRLEGDESVELLRVGGSVLYDLRLNGARDLPAGRDEARLPLQVLPGNRCDEHAIGQATAPYDFSLTLRVGDRRLFTALPPPRAVQDAASAMLLDHCGALRQ